MLHQQDYDCGDGGGGMERRGLLIVVEGGDRSGKSTLAKALAARLHAHLASFPDRTTPLGQLISSYLQGTTPLSPRAIHLLFSANRHELAPAALTARITTGQSVVLDRYVPSGVAYSVAKGLAMEWCREADRGLPKPDVVLFVKVPAEVAAARAGYGQERYERREFQIKVLDAFSRLQAAEQQEGASHWVTIDGTQTPEEMLQCALEAVNSHLPLLLRNSPLSFY